MTSAFERLSGPSERHQAFALLIGQWRVAMATHTADGAATRSNDVRAEKSWIADGRYVREEVTGTFSGAPHKKLTLLGFNNVRSRYEYLSADNYDAVLLLYVSAPGTQLGDGSRIEVFADYVYAGDGPEVAGTLVTIRTVLEIESEDHHRLRNFYKAPGKDEYLFLEYEYRREG